MHSIRRNLGSPIGEEPPGSRHRSRMVRASGLVAGTVLMLGTMAALGGPAGADPTSPWALQNTPNPSGSIGDSLSSVSCASATSCEAVGSMSLANVGTPLVEFWNGTAWTVQPAPVVPGSTATVLISVSCASPNACMAVGYAVDGAGNRVLASESWNGSAWTVQAISAPAATTSPLLNSVSCATAISCEAVGWAANASNTQILIADTWNGTAWTNQTPATPAGVGANLTSVTCVAANSCEAVGSSSTGPGLFGGLAESWNGAAWSEQSVPAPGGTIQSGFSAVSCPSASSCTAVGTASVSGPGPLTTGEPEIGTWNGSAWSVQALPAPAGELDTSLASVSCTSPSNCEAVGSEDTQDNSFGIQTTVAYSWNGLGWTHQDMPAGDLTELNSVSCTTTCEAVGQDGSDGPGPVSTAQLAGVEAAPATTLPVSSTGLTGLLDQLLGLIVGIVAAL